MTQLMLFEAPVPTTLTAASVARQATPQARQAAIGPIAASADEPQRMGNLAYLVIARYDMVARRREAQRRAAAARLQAHSA